MQTWLPELQNLGAAWLVLQSDLDRAIPEPFLRGLKQARIEPVIRFYPALDRLPDLKEMGTLLEVYARWGARFVVFFDRPNARSAWPLSAWAQQDLVERFLDRYLPVANLALQVGLTPIFPPLEPGGSYWDTAFLRSALQGMQRRKQEALLDGLVLSAYAWSGQEAGALHSLDWGAGGPERWPQSRPYQTPQDSQDQCGFRIFDWYQATAQSVLHEPSPVFLFQAALPGDPASLSAEMMQDPAYSAAVSGAVRLLAGEKVLDPLNAENELEPLPNQVIGSAFWLLGADASSPYQAQAWFQADGQKHPVVESIHTWRRERPVSSGEKLKEDLVPVTTARSGHPIQHYLLLPCFEWGISDWYLEVIRPFVKKYHPTVGFSPDEAIYAAQVTIIGNLQSFPENLLPRLKKAGCKIDQISGDGTNIASQLAER